MILVDSNIWCDFFRKGDAVLDQLLADNRVILHSLVIGELAMGNLPARQQVLRDLRQLPRIKEATWYDCFMLLEEKHLYGKRIQWNDLQILASVMLTPGTMLWTRDLRLAEIAMHAKVSFLSG